MDGFDDPPGDGEARALAALLDWYAAMGVDASIDEVPHDRFTAPPEAPPPPLLQAPGRVAAPAAARPATQSAEGLVAQARSLAAGAADLEDLRARWAEVPGFTLGAASRMIFSASPPGAPLMLVAAAPGEDDERSGAIFAGPPGRLLDAMLAAIGLSRDGVALAHVVPWRPPGARQPTPLELALCLPFARRQIALARPRALLLLGERAAQPLLGTRDPVSRLRGRWLSYEGEAATLKALVTYAPAYLIGQPLQKRRAWADLLMVEAELDAVRRRAP